MSLPAPARIVVLQKRCRGCMNTAGDIMLYGRMNRWWASRRSSNWPALGLLITVLLGLLLPIASADAQVRVRGYFRKDGTYVQPHMRSAPDGNPYNNWSFPGNINPYTGKVAPGDPAAYLRKHYGRNSTIGAPTSPSSRSLYEAAPAPDLRLPHFVAQGALHRHMW